MPWKKLYDIEDRGRTMSRDERWSLRQSEAGPIWDSIGRWLEQVKDRTVNVILPKSDFGKAIQYVRNHFAELKLYLTDDSLPIDNNQTEQLMKQVAEAGRHWQKKLVIGRQPRRR